MPDGYPQAETDRAVAAVQSNRHNLRMPVRFLGSIQQLKDRLLPLDLDGDWESGRSTASSITTADRSRPRSAHSKGSTHREAIRPRSQTCRAPDARRNQAAFAAAQ